MSKNFKFTMVLVVATLAALIAASESSTVQVGPGRTIQVEIRNR